MPTFYKFSLNFFFQSVHYVRFKGQSGQKIGRAPPQLHIELQQNVPIKLYEIERYSIKSCLKTEMVPIQLLLLTYEGTIGAKISVAKISVTFDFPTEIFAIVFFADKNFR